MLTLKFSPSKNNAKLAKLAKQFGGAFYSFSTMSGGTNCPYAKECKSTAVEQKNGKWKIVDGPHTLFRCFSASQEVLFPALRNQRLHNSELYKLLATDKNAAMDSLLNSIPRDARLIRVNVGGDIPTQPAFDLWNDVASLLPDVRFYAYTKSLPFWVKRLNSIAPNFILTASFGGWKDELISLYNLRYAKVVNSEYQARKLGLTIDHDDSHAAMPGPSFALLVHGTQPAGSMAANALKRMGGVGGSSSYSK